MGRVEGFGPSRDSRGLIAVMTNASPSLPNVLTNFLTLQVWPSSLFSPCRLADRRIPSIHPCRGRERYTMRGFDCLVKGVLERKKSTVHPISFHRMVDGMGQGSNLRGTDDKWKGRGGVNFYCEGQSNGKGSGKRTDGIPFPALSLSLSLCVCVCVCVCV
mmetsp:Transcript_54208/g.106054  ORF Transcript_54208/g.106054 Transcript_54208/m.106054 type:complete len:160 (-) Transcript_54208:1869-2348(-)